MYDEEKDLNGQQNTSGADNDNVEPAIDAQENAAGEFNNSDNNSTNNNDTNNQGSYYNNSYYNGGNNQNNTTGGQNNNSYYNGDYNNQNTFNQNGKQQKPKGNKAAVIISCIAAVFVIGIIGVALITSRLAVEPNTSISEKNQETTASKDVPSIGSTEVIDSSDSSSDASTGVVITDVSNVVSDTMNSVVAITSTTLVQSNYYDDFSYYFGFGGDSGNSGNGQQYEQQAAGSGIIIEQTDSELLIVTNNHVVEGADSLTIQFSDDESVEGYIKGTDTTADIAVVAVPLTSIKESTLGVIKKATIGSSDDITVGEGVIAIGNALGYGQSVTTGIISAKDREVTFDDNNSMKLLQTDAAINGGNSGGALINSKGEVIGINVAKYSSDGSSTSSSVEGMGFAIPISSVTDIISGLETKETRTKVDESEKGYLGIQGNTVSDDIAEQYSMPNGVYVYSVTKNAGAEKAGITETDIITKFDGQTVNSMEDLQNALAYYKAGENVTVTIAYRDGREYKEKEVTVTLSKASEITEEETTN